MRKFLIWGYDHSAAGLLFPKVSDSAKVGYAIGANIGLIVASAAFFSLRKYL